MQYITKKCPKCGSAYSTMQPKGTGFYGSPLRQCSKCGELFIDKDYREIAIDGIRTADTKRLSGSTLFACTSLLFMAVALICLYINDSSLFSSGRSIWSIFFAIVLLGMICFLVIDEVRGYGERQSFLEQERRNSEKRLQDYQYARFLQKLGYTVPEQYLRHQQ